MEVKFKKGQSVRITKRNGEIIDGIVRDWDYNICTFVREYNIDYMKNGQVWTVICVPEDVENIKSLDPLLYSQLTHQKYIRTK